MLANSIAYGVLGAAEGDGVCDFVHMMRKDLDRQPWNSFESF